MDEVAAVTRSHSGVTQARLERRLGRACPDQPAAEAFHGSAEGHLIEKRAGGRISWISLAGATLAGAVEHVKLRESRIEEHAGLNEERSTVLQAVSYLLQAPERVAQVIEDTTEQDDVEPAPSLPSGECDDPKNPNIGRVIT